MFGLVGSLPRAAMRRYKAFQEDGIAGSPPWKLEIFFFLLPFFLAPYGKAERAPPSPNPYLLWMRAPR
jgi:hypothetical protein